ncbi:hypothetical protein B0H13DRAFT_2542465 [Mycena leptocephala]|nr:hypothetical protein B0H13DRAFT_2542465 [Mycena leptocephala]
MFIMSIAACLCCQLVLTSYFVSSCLGWTPERHAAYENIFGRRPAPRTGPSPQPPQRLYAAYPNLHPQGYHPHPNQYQRPPAPPYHPHPHPHAYLPHSQQQQHAPQYGNDGRTRQHTAPSLRPLYQPAVPTPVPHRPTNAQVAMSQQEKPGQQWRRSASPAPLPHSHALLQSGPPALSLAF